MDVTDEQYRTISRIAAGSQSAPRAIRAAAVRLITGFEDEYDVAMLIEYIENI